MLIAIGVFIFVIVIVVIHDNLKTARLDNENQEILRWSQTPEIQQRIREMEARGESIEYSEHTKKMLRKAKRYQ